MYDKENMMPAQREIYEISGEKIRHWIKNGEGFGDLDANIISSTEESKDGKEYRIHKIIDIRPEKNEAIEVTGKKNDGMKNYLEVKKHSENGVVEEGKGCLKYTGQDMEEIAQFLEKKIT